MRGLVTPPLPFAEAERKADPNRLEHNTVPGKLPTAQIALFAKPTPSSIRLRPGPSGLGRLQPEAAGAALAERLFQLGQDRLGFHDQRPRRIDDQKAGRGQRSANGLRRDAELEAQALSGGGAGADRLSD